MCHSNPGVQVKLLNLAEVWRKYELILDSEKKSNILAKSYLENIVVILNL